MRLHLGCGEVYLEGYTNIDYPPSEHTVQTKTKVDKYANILELRYKKDSIDEIRMHHVFEHFSRPVALALLASWRSWLKPGGLLRIEVPDFDVMARKLLNPLIKDEERGVALRHIFGSQEASWAVHYEGWSARRLKKILEGMGYEVVMSKKNSYQGTANIDLTAKKTSRSLTQPQLEARAKKLLSFYLVNDSPTEKRLLSVWLGLYQDQIKKTWAK